VVAYYLLAAKHEQAQHTSQAGDDDRTGAGGASGAGPVAVGNAPVCACGGAMCRSYLMIHWGGCFHPGLLHCLSSSTRLTMLVWTPRTSTLLTPVPSPPRPPPCACCVCNSPGLRDGDAPFTPDDAAALAVMGRAALPRDTADGPAAPAVRCACPLGPAYGPLCYPCSVLAACWAPTAAGAGASGADQAGGCGGCGGCGGMSPCLLTSRGEGREGLKSVADEEGH